MKKIYLIIAFICLIQCNVKKNVKYFDTRFSAINAKIYKIEEKNNMYVYHFKSDTLRGVFAKEKKCNLSTITSWEKVKLNKNYRLILDPMIIANKRSSGLDITINGDFVWSSDMDETYYENCNNICGDKIYELK